MRCLTCATLPPDDVIKWKHLLPYWPFVRGIHRSPVNSSSQRPMTRSFDIFFDLCLNKRLSKQSRRWWFETPSCSLWHQCNVLHGKHMMIRHIMNLIHCFDRMTLYGVDHVIVSASSAQRHYRTQCWFILTRSSHNVLEKNDRICHGWTKVFPQIPGNCAVVFAIFFHKVYFSVICWRHMTFKACQIITNLTVYPTGYSGDNKKNQKIPALLTLCDGNPHRWPMDFHHKGKTLCCGKHFDIMSSGYGYEKYGKIYPHGTNNIATSKQHTTNHGKEIPSLGPRYNCTRLYLVTPTTLFVNQRHFLPTGHFHFQYTDTHIVRYITSLQTLHNLVCISPLVRGNRLRHYGPS